MLVVALLAVAPGGCGASDTDAPLGPDVAHCPRLDDYLRPLYALLDEGKLSNLSAAVSRRVPEDGRRDLVATVVRLLGAFETGTFSSLAAAVTASDEDSTGLQSVLGRLVRWLAVQSPGAPYLEVMGTLRRTLNSCQGPPVLRLLADLLEDEALLRAVFELLADPELGELFADLEFEGAEGRDALTLLVRNLLVSATGPDFRVATLIDLLGFITDTTREPWPQLLEGLQRLLGPGPGLEALQGLLSCMLEVDPAVAIGPLIYDLLTSEGLDLAGAIDALSDADGPVLDAGVKRLLVTILDFFIGDMRARRAVVVVVTELLRDDVAAAVLADLADLLEGGVIGEVVDALAVLASGECGP